MKRLSVLLICSLALVCLPFAPTWVAADENESVRASGRWTYKPKVIAHWHETLDDEDTVEDESKPLGFVYAIGHETGTWTGTFEGSSYDVFLLKDYRDEIDLVELPYGEIYFEGSVVGEEGTLVINFAPGEKIAGVWKGDWEILSGTGGLEKLYGEGRWKGPSRDLVYWGEIYFVGR